LLGQSREVWDYSFWPILAEHNVAVLSVAELYTPLVVENQGAHQAQQRGNGFFVESCGLWFFLGLGFVPFGLVLFVASGVMFPGAQEVWSQCRQALHQCLVVGIHQGVHGSAAAVWKSAVQLGNLRPNDFSGVAVVSVVQVLCHHSAN